MTRLTDLDLKNIINHERENGVPYRQIKVKLNYAISIATIRRIGMGIYPKRAKIREKLNLAPIRNAKMLFEERLADNPDRLAILGYYLFFNSPEFRALLKQLRERKEK